MATVSAVMFRNLLRGELPPVGGRVVLAIAPPPTFPGYEPFWVDSGTSALALALISAREAAPGVACPEVILPGYGCPDLVAAALYAGVRPVLADLAPDDSGYDIASLTSMLSPATVAVVAVNFLGIAERLEAIRAVLADKPQVTLIEDNAQWYPEGRPLTSDYISLSFGRGKPVSLLGGGLLLVRKDRLTVAQAAATRQRSISAPAGGAGYAAKATIYNLMLQRHLYALVTRNPWLKVGETVFEPLTGIAPLGARVRYLGSNVERHLARFRHLEEKLSAICRHSSCVAVDLPRALAGRAGRLLRYPVLCHSAAMRDGLLAASRSQGLGLTAMYRQALPAIDGVGSRTDSSQPLPNAKAFASRLLTLPVHEGVRAKDLERLRILLR